MSGAIFIIVLALVTAILCGVVSWRWRFKSVQIDWTAFMAMSLGSIAIGLFYAAILQTAWHGHSIIPLIPYSRIIFGFVLLSTTTMAVFVLRNNGRHK